VDIAPGDQVQHCRALENSVKLKIPLLALLLASLCAACSAEQVSRGVYEGSRTYNKATQSTPLEKSKNELPSYDQYEKERQGGAPP
jgi:hypothetical protein